MSGELGDTIMEDIEKVADGLNQLCIIFDEIAWELQQKYKVDLSKLRNDLRAIRDNIASVIPE